MSIGVREDLDTVYTKDKIENMIIFEDKLGSRKYQATYKVKMKNNPNRYYYTVLHDQDGEIYYRFFDIRGNRSWSTYLHEDGVSWCEQSDKEAYEMSHTFGSEKFLL